MREWSRESSLFNAFLFHLHLVIPFHQINRCEIGFALQIEEHVYQVWDGKTITFCYLIQGTIVYTKPHSPIRFPNWNYWSRKGGLTSPNNPILFQHFTILLHFLQNRTLKASNWNLDRLVIKKRDRVFNYRSTSNIGLSSANYI